MVTIIFIQKGWNYCLVAILYFNFQTLGNADHHGQEQPGK